LKPKLLTKIIRLIGESQLDKGLFRFLLGAYGQLL